VSVTTTGKVEKVRGTNASLINDSKGNAEGGSNALSERDPSRLHITRRQMVLALGLAVVAIIATVYTVNAITSGDQSFPAVVTTSKLYDLNFPNTAKVTSVMVTVGQHVKEGQVLARQDSSSLATQESADEATVKADQQLLVQSGAPQVTVAQREQDALEVQQSQTALSNADAALTSAEESGRANVAAAQASVTDASALEASDNARYTQACPNGPVPPSSSLSGAQLQAAEAAYTHCQNLQLTMDQDQTTLRQAQAQLPVVESESQAAIDSAQATANSAQSALNLANYQATLQGAPSNSATQAQADANLTQAQAQLAGVQRSIQDASLVAPDGGVISEIYGEAGENLGPNGVEIYQAPASLPTNSSGGFSLFPTSSSGQGSSSSSSGSEPFIELVGGRQQVLAQVTESQVGSVPVGHTAKVYFSVLNLTESGVVSQVGLSPTRNNSAVTYDVTITLDHTVPGLLPGMTAAVRT
jgi:multidrug efflux pump subunit AcrA (membrane-fusion protein)